MKITLAILEQNKACADQRRLFDETFPKGANVNARNLSKARKARLDVLWLGRLLPQDRKSEYDKVRAPAWAEYYKARASALAEYDKACAPARAEYEKACAPALAEHEKACASALAEYDKVCGAALVRAFEGL